MNKQFLRIISILLFGTLTGCATIMGSNSHVMPINSQPSDATVTITDENGSEIFSGRTPTTVTLKKSNGKYFGKKSYNVKISKSGFTMQTIPVTASPSGWYIFGNAIFGGLVGWLIVDPLSGNMYSLSPENIDSTLIATNTTSHNNTSTDGGIAIMLLKDVPNHLHEKMQLIN